MCPWPTQIKLISWPPDITSRDAAIAYDLYQILILDSTPLNIHIDETVMNGGLHSVDAAAEYPRLVSGFSAVAQRPHTKARI